MIAKITVIDNDGKEIITDEVKVQEIFDAPHMCKRCFVRMNFPIAVTKEDVEKMYKSITEVHGRKLYTDDDNRLLEDYVIGGSDDIQ